MDLDKQVVDEVKDLFDIKYASEDDSASTEGMSANFADLENEVSSVISNMDDKGEVLDTPPKEEVVEEPAEEQEETVEVEETELETIDDLIANSVEEAKALTTAQEVQADEEKKVEEEQLIEDFDSIEVSQVSVEEEIVSQEEIEDVQKQLAEVATDPDLKISHDVTEGVYPETGNPSFDNMSEKIASEVAEKTPVVLEDEDIEVIPCKDSEGNIKGEIKMKDVAGVSYDRKGKPNITGGEILWNIESPSELYDEFYRIKADKINTFSGGEQLDFARLYQDLYSTSVDTSTEILDKDILMEKLDLVVQGINRVAMIQVQVNQQQFVWKRFVELLRGALARVQYLKPVLKQDGLQLEHMGDVEFYSERLNALKDSAHDCMKNLERAFEAVSRKVSVMLTVQTKHTTRVAPDSYSQSNQQTYQAPPPAPVETVEEEAVAPVTEDMGDYDSFEVGAKVVAGKPKPGECDWGDIW